MNQEKGHIKTFTDLDAWKEGHALVIEIYRTTKEFPHNELFGITSQMRRCAVSITSNIAEGFGRKSKKEKLWFFQISQGSVTELQNQLIICKDVGYIDEKTFENLYNKTLTVHKITTGLIKATHTHYS